MLTRLIRVLALVVSAAVLLVAGAACGDNGNNVKPPTLPTLPPATIGRPDLPPLTQAPPALAAPSVRGTQPPLNTNPSSRATQPALQPAQPVAFSACSLLTSADAAAALNAVGGRVPPTGSPLESNNGTRCIIGSGSEYVAIDFVRTASRDAFDPAVRGFAQSIANSDPQIMASPVLMGVGRTYNAALVFARQRPQDGVFFVLVSGGYLQMTVRSATAVPSLQTVLPAVDALAQRAIAHGGFSPG